MVYTGSVQREARAKNRKQIRRTQPISVLCGQGVLVYGGTVRRRSGLVADDIKGTALIHVPVTAELRWLRPTEDRWS